VNAVTGEVLAGRFELLEEIGKTRAFREFRARDRQLNRTVSVKVLRVRRPPEPAVLARLLRHAREALQLSHRNIVRVYAADTEGGRFFVVEDLDRSDSLRDLLRRQGALDPEDAVAIAAQVCAAVSAAHGRGSATARSLPTA
jgi:serine/threonine protein kinase